MRVLCLFIFCVYVIFLGLHLLSVFLKSTLEKQKIGTGF